MTANKLFEQIYNTTADKFYFSPGKANIIGEHSDYHDGLVMPGAIHLGIRWSAKKNNDRVIRGYSATLNGEVGHFSIDQKDRTTFEWLLYLQGVIEVLKKREYEIGGVDFTISSTLPIGSGLSSSSCLATGFAFIMNDLYQLGLSREEIARVGCEAEWWYGTTGGTMDQFCIANAKEGAAVMLDCRSMDYEYVKIPDKIQVVVFETTVRHKQINSPFDERKRQANEVVRIAQAKYPDQKITKLRDVSAEMLMSLEDELKNEFGGEKANMIMKRAIHPIQERDRVLQMKEALESDNFKQIGDILYSCHDSLKNNYEVSCSELDVAVEEGRTIDGIIGSRMVGGGFGGCTINLVYSEKAEKFATELEERFAKATGINGRSYICKFSPGVHEIDEYEL